MEFNPLEEIRTSFTRVSPVRQHLRAIFLCGLLWRWNLVSTVYRMNKIPSGLIFLLFLLLFSRKFRLKHITAHRFCPYSHFFISDPTFVLFFPKLTRLWWRQQCSLQSPGLLFLQIQAVSLSLQKYWWPLTGVAPSNFSSTDDTRLSVVHRVAFPPWHSSIQSSCWVEPR